MISLNGTTIVTVTQHGPHETATEVRIGQRGRQRRTCGDELYLSGAT